VSQRRLGPSGLPREHQQPKVVTEHQRGEAVRGLRGTATCELGLVATMATRWSRKLDELYLRQNGLHGEVEDVEELRAVLQLRGIGQWCSDSVDFSVAATVSPPVVALAWWRRTGKKGMARERSVVSTRPSHMSARLRRGGAGQA
jgi:hypothetical protein